MKHSAQLQSAIFSILMFSHELQLVVFAPSASLNALTRCHGIGASATCPQIKPLQSEIETDGRRDIMAPSTVASTVYTADLTGPVSRRDA